MPAALWRPGRACCGKPAGPRWCGRPHRARGNAEAKVSGRRSRRGSQLDKCCINDVGIFRLGRDCFRRHLSHPRGTSLVLNSSIIPHVGGRFRLASARRLPGSSCASSNGQTAEMATRHARRTGQELGARGSNPRHHCTSGMELKTRV